MTDGSERVGGPVRDLGGGVEIPVLGLGVWQVPDGSATEQAVEWALEAGYRHIDTAMIYRNERGVGAAVARSGIPREQIFVTTKWLPLRRGPRHELERSLERLGMGYVDLYLIHWPVPGRMASGWRGLAALRERGLARAIGVSNFNQQRIARLIARGPVRPAANQVLFHPQHFPVELLAACKAAGIVVEAYSPLARGAALELPAVREIAARLERTPAQVVLRWAVQHETVVIPKSVRAERIRENAAIFDFSLAPEDMARLDGLDSTSHQT